MITSSSKQDKKFHKDLFDKILVYDQNLHHVLFVKQSDMGWQIFKHICVPSDYMHVVVTKYAYLSLIRLQRRHGVKIAPASSEQSISMLDLITSSTQASPLLKISLGMGSITHILQYCCALCPALMNCMTIQMSMYLLLRSRWCFLNLIRFRALVLSKDIKISQNSWPFFMYDKYDPDEPCSRFTCRYYLLRVSGRLPMNVVTNIYCP